MGKKILMIDDEPDFTDLIATLLKFHRLEVETCNKPETVLEKIGQEDYALLICDLMMDEVDGFEICRKFRDHYQETPIIVLSAKTLTDTERKQLMELKTHFMPKPFEPKKLVEKVRELLDAA